MKKIVFVLLVAAIALLGINATFVGKDPLHKKEYEIQLTEFKDGQPKTTGKPKADVFYFKGGKVFSDFAAEPLGFNEYIKYEIKKDSSYTEEDEERHYYEIEASKENDDGVVITILMKIDDIDIEGSIKTTKSEKLKKHYEFVGKEKVVKKK